MSNMEFIRWQTTKISRIAEGLGFTKSNPIVWNQAIAAIIFEVGSHLRSEWERSHNKCPYCGQVTELIPELGHCFGCESSGLIIGGNVICEE